MSEKLVLIDGHSIANRAFYGVPDLTNASGLHTNAIYGFLNILFKILDEENPDYLVVTFDEHAPTFRHEMYEAYKGTRKPMPEELRQQIPVLRDLLNAMKVCVVSKPGLEADDIMGTLAKKAQANGMEVSLVSGDRDLLQISDEHILIRIPKTSFGKTTIKDYKPADVLAEWQVTPKQFIELKALMGDTADNIPGVPKVGEKTATELMVNYGSIDGIYEHIDEISKKSIKESLIENKALAELSLKLATIKIDCDVELDKEAAGAEGYFNPDSYEFMKKLEFKKLLDRFSADAVKEKTENISLSVSECESGKVFAEALSGTVNDFGLFLLKDEESLKAASFCIKEGEAYKAYYVSDLMGFEGLSGLLKNALESCKGRLYTLDIKKNYDIIDSEDTSNYFDTLIGAYLINPLKNDYDEESIASEYLGLTIAGKKERFGKKSVPESIMTDNKAVMSYCADCAYVALAGGLKVSEKLSEMKMDRVMSDIEMPLTSVLYDMEKTGVLVRRDELATYGEKLGVRILELEKKIKEESGEDFNINSPKQLGEILFEKMQIPGGKKTKTGYSTAADVLEKLAPEYPFVADILEYRALTKLKSTYADGLAGYIGPDGRIHTSFNQTITATGRISSTDPNLQNIPIRTELGRQLRGVFVPADGYVFVDADYSQIELRVLASLSGDKELIEAYKEDKDIHRITASKVFGVPFDDVTDQMRRNAKAVNFGIVYGISSFGLSQDLSISTKEAKSYIEQYFKTYPQIKEYLDKLVSDAKEKGYSETYFGRRRPIPELSSSNFMQRQFGERVAMNAPIQGTAADIMKIAMLHAAKALKDNNLKSKIILQVHDELVIETLESEKDKVCDLLIEAMKSAADLAVSLEVGLGVGNNWLEAH
ncbi:MAG: DNA polymerase I [Lachnospiraceae bacterium]|nr:DNA polymerase I [Lachnospiraceae bacterium]